MRTRNPIALAAGAALLAACSGEPRPVATSAPTVTYSYRSDAELREAQDRAEVWCDERYNASARRGDRWPANGEVTFVCVPN